MADCYNSECKHRLGSLFEPFYCAALTCKDAIDKDGNKFRVGGPSFLEMTGFNSLDDLLHAYEKAKTERDAAVRALDGLCNEREEKK